jgi:RNA polymerase sigma-70 factor (ECF subfamily)
MNLDPRRPESGSAVPVSLPTLEEIFRDEAAFVGRTLRFLGVRDSHVEDACQEVFVVIHRRLSSFTGGSLRAWVRQICVGVAQNHRRGQRRRPEEITAEPPAGATPPDQEGALERRRLRGRLLLVLDGLPEEQREAFVLYEIEELTMVEVAAALDCPLQTAYSRLHAARSKIQAAAGEGEP